MARAWTPAEDAIIRENAAMGPSWDGYRLLLPGRTQGAIMSRRQYLGVQFGGGGAKAGASCEKNRRKRHALPDTGWTQQQNEALVRGVQRMTEETGHTVRECVVQFARIVTASRKAKR